MLPRKPLHHPIRAKREPLECSSSDSEVNDDTGSAQVESQKVEEVPIVGPPRKFDVLLGRGRAHASHPGNKRLQIVVNVNKDWYNASNSRHEKTRITENIVNQIKRCGVETGRFLKPDGQGGWIEVNDDVARIKVSQTLRYTRRSLHMSVIPETDEHPKLPPPCVQNNVQAPQHRPHLHTSSAFDEGLPVSHQPLIQPDGNVVSMDKVTSSKLVRGSQDQKDSYRGKTTASMGMSSSSSRVREEPLLSDNEIYAALGYDALIQPQWSSTKKKQPDNRKPPPNAKTEDS